MSSSPPYGPQTPATSLKAAIEKAISASISDLESIQPPLPPRLLAKVILDYVPESTAPGSYVPTVVELLSAGPEGEHRVHAGGLEVEPFQGSFSDWVISRAKAIDNATGDLSVISALLSECAEDEAVAKYQTGPFASLEILVYEFQCDWRLEDLDDGVGAIKKVLEETDVETALERILPGILQDDRELWASVWAWMKEKGWGAVSPVLRDWTGPPKDLRKDYVRAGLEIAYTGKDIENEVWDVYEILRAVGNQLTHVLQTTIPPDMIESSDPDLETKELFLEPSGFAMKAFFTLVTAAEQLGISLGQALEYRVEASEEKQVFSFESVLKGGHWESKSDSEVEAHIHDARWLHNYAKVFGRIDGDYFEESLLQNLLECGKYNVAKKLYVDSPESPISAPKLEKMALTNFYYNYDHASNGNKTRGKMKSASLALSLLNSFPASDALAQARDLLSATHSLSSYSLSLHPPQPLTPRELRHFPTPLDLIPTLLSQNPGLYSQPTPLIPIFTSLLTGVSKPPHNLDLSSFILQQAILIALSADDFQTAYSLIQRQAIPPSTADLKPLDDEENKLWTAILQAARHRPQSDPVLDSAELGKRMELAAITLATAPEDALGDILGVWRRLEEELLVMEEQERSEERGAYEGYEGAKGMGMVGGPGAFEGKRKRDIVSSAVTSGLVSGIGWLVGAQPAGGRGAGR